MSSLCTANTSNAFQRSHITNAISLNRATRGLAKISLDLATPRCLVRRRCISRGRRMGKIEAFSRKSGVIAGKDNKLLPKRKKPSPLGLGLLFNIGRDGVIRTLDPLHPMQVRYQAALRPDDA